MSPADTAAKEFLRLLRGAPAAIAAGKKRDAVEGTLQCWLAIACHAGADLPQLEQLLPAYRNPTVYRPRRGWRDEIVPEAEARRDCADAIRPRQAWAPMLARARDRALEADPEGTRTRALYELAAALGVALTLPLAEPERKAA